MPISKHRRRPKPITFGFGTCTPMDGNTKARIIAYADAWNSRNRQPRQHKGPITRAYREVLLSLLAFHNTQTGRCFPSYETIAARPGADLQGRSRSTVAEAIKVLETAGILTWDRRVRRVSWLRRGADGHRETATKLVRNSNAYQFIDPIHLPKFSESRNPAGTKTQECLPLSFLRSTSKAKNLSDQEQDRRAFAARDSYLQTMPRATESLAAINANQMVRIQAAWLARKSAR